MRDELRTVSRTLEGERDATGKERNTTWTERDEAQTRRDELRQIPRTSEDEREAARTERDETAEEFQTGYWLLENFMRTVPEILGGMEVIPDKCRIWRLHCKLWWLW